MLTKRQCQEKDRDFVYNLYRENMKEHFDLHFPGGWSDKNFNKGICPNRIKILEFSGQPVGFYEVEKKEDFLYVRNVQMKKGCGANPFTLIKYIIEEAKKMEVNSLRGKVFKTNERAINLWKIFGFEILSEIKAQGSYWLEKKLN